jgi:hypothetical protein
LSERFVNVNDAAYSTAKDYPGGADMMIGEVA